MHTLDKFSLYMVISQLLDGILHAVFCILLCYEFLLTYFMRAIIGEFEIFKILTFAKVAWYESPTPFGEILYDIEHDNHPLHHEHRVTFLLFGNSAVGGNMYDFIFDLRYLIDQVSRFYPDMWIIVGSLLPNPRFSDLYHNKALELNERMRRYCRHADGVEFLDLFSKMSMGAPRLPEKFFDFEEEEVLNLKGFARVIHYLGHKLAAIPNIW